MSTGNIVSIEQVEIPVPELAEVPLGVVVTFKTRQGERAYLYVGPAAYAILDGDDPAHWAGTLIEKSEL